MSPAPAKTSAPGDSRDPRAEAVGRRVAGGDRKKQLATRVSKIRRSLPDFLATKNTPTLLGRPVASFQVAIPRSTSLRTNAAYRTGDDPRSGSTYGPSGQASRIKLKASAEGLSRFSLARPIHLASPGLRRLSSGTGQAPSSGQETRSWEYGRLVVPRESYRPLEAQSSLRAPAPLGRSAG